MSKSEKIATEFAIDLIKYVRNSLKSAKYDLDDQPMGVGKVDNMAFDVYVCKLKAATIEYNIHDFSDTKSGLYFNRDLDFCGTSGLAHRMNCSSYELAEPVFINIGDPSFINTIKILIDQMEIPKTEDDILEESETEEDYKEAIEQFQKEHSK